MAKAAPGRGPRFELSDRKLAALWEDVVLCRRAHVLNRLDAADPAHPNTPLMIGYLAQWADAGGMGAEILTELLGRFPAAERGRLPLRSHLFMRLSQGILNFVLKNPDGGDFDFVIAVSTDGCAGDDLPLLAHFWKAQAARQSGALDDALGHARQSRELATRAGYPRLAARAQALDGLLLLDSGQEGAVDALWEAGSALHGSEDWLWLGRIQYGLGLASIEQGCYQAALETFTAARDYWLQAGEPHEELGWAHVQIGRALRQMAARLADCIDAEAERRRRAPRRDAAGSGASRQRLEHLRTQAFSALADAAEVFHGLGIAQASDAVRLERSALWTDCGDLERAGREAEQCYLHASRRRDRALMAQARLAQSRIERIRCDEGMSGDPLHHAERAREYGAEALALALRCDALPAKRRILAGIYISQGLLFTSQFFDDAAAARECCQSAGEYLNPAQRDELWEQYQMLAARVHRSGTMDARLRKWSEGLMEGKTLQQVAEEFAGIVISAVWAREGKNVSRVVARLSVSPKKVRRILNRAGVKS